MRKVICLLVFVPAWASCSVSSLEHDEDLVAWWKFDEGKGKAATDSVRQINDAINGNFKYVEGVSGSAIRFDGYTTHVGRKAADAPRLTDAFTIEAWVALQVYPWNWTGIVDRASCRVAGREVAPEAADVKLRPGLIGAKYNSPDFEDGDDTKAGLFFGIDGEGHLGMKLNIGGRMHECVTEQTLALLKWSHIAGTFDQNKGITLYINGNKAGYLAVQGELDPNSGSDMLIGKSHERLSPVGTEREASRKTLSNMVFDGLIDEVKIYKRALSADEVARSCASMKPKTEQPLNRRVMPSGPKNVPKRFAAYYTRLRYDQLWEEPWRVGWHPDILVTFDDSPVRVVFWRGTSYGASWVTENGIWMGEQSLEDSGTGWGLSEHMADKQCRYSHVRLIENHDARVVVHWRYAVADIRYTINHADPISGWGDWVDEYYTIYPDVVATRKQVLWTSSDVDGFQWQETIFFGQPGTRPEDNIEIEAFTLANMDGLTHTYSYADGAPEDYPKPKGANIQLTNLKAANKPFIIFEPVRPIRAFGSGSRSSKFPWWNHWPVSQIPSDGRKVSGPDRPFHSSLSNYEPQAVRGEGDSYIAVSLYGMTDKSTKDIVPLARSWNYPARLNLACSGFDNKGYDKYERAYVLGCKDNGNSSTLRFELAASKESPVVNPAFIVKGWGNSGAVLKINGKRIARDENFRFGHRRAYESTDLIVWTRVDSTRPILIELAASGP